MSSTPNEKISALHEAQKKLFATSKTRPLMWRKQQLAKVVKFIDECSTQISDALTKDLGKTAFEGEVTEIEVTKLEALEAIESLDSWSATEYVSAPGALMPSFCEMRKEPRGVTLVIGPFNYPFSTGFGPAVSALAAGNTCIIKPSEMCPATDKMLRDLIPKYFDPEVLAVVSGAIPETTKLMELEWDMIFFTGSERVGKIIAGAAAKTLSPVILELGGKSPLIITKEMPELEAMANRIMWGKTINAGQTCVAPDYVLVQEENVEAVLEAFKTSLENMFGKTNEQIKNSTFSRNVSVDHTKRLISMIDDAKSNGGKIVTGGSEYGDAKAKYFPPTIIYNPGPKSKILTEEIFGCILPIIPYKTNGDAIRYINTMRGTPLALYVFTRIREHFDFFMDAVPSGGAVHNDVLLHFACSTIPFGGLGTSGYGSGHGKHGFDSFTHTRGVLSKPCKGIFEFGGIRYPPYDRYGGFSGPLFKFLVAKLPNIPVMYSTALYYSACTLGCVGTMYLALNYAGVEPREDAKASVNGLTKFIGELIVDLGKWIGGEGLARAMARQAAQTCRAA
ncbi:hypothetical protein TL16_g13209 [Triparma laevis f. inornata]|uniref:Aldehyde dehydrogenase domain-containing protein n=1 Tax=Triparma laevis f. inornata TaxID=1714386 RepID=A0A9W7EYY7_9STRA|nr:hypothetical protein TL16_g13209 [Triparma laevis f. inornata]